MATKERPGDRGRRRGLQLYALAARDFRTMRVDRGLSLDDCARAIGISPSHLSRIERGLCPTTALVRLAQLHALVGNDVAVQSFPAASPLRDAAHASLLTRFRGLLHPSWRIDFEVPLPLPGDRRAWDALIQLPTCRYGVEAETAPTDAQALVRRIQLKRRDGRVDGVILLVPATRRVRAFLGHAEPILRPLFPQAGRRTVELLAAGVDPGSSAIVELRR